MPSSHLIPCHPLLLLPSIFPSIIYMYTHKSYFLCIYHIYTVNEIPGKGTLETVICSSYWEKGIGFIWKKQRALFPFLTLLLSTIADAGLAQPTPKVTVPICIIFTSTFSLSLFLPLPTSSLFLSLLPPGFFLLSWLGSGQKPLGADLNSWCTAVHTLSSLQCVLHSLSCIPTDMCTPVLHSSPPSPFHTLFTVIPLPCPTLQLSTLPGITSQRDGLHLNPSFSICFRETFN